MSTSTLPPQSLHALEAALEYHERSAAAIRATIQIVALTFNPSISPSKYRGKSIAVALAEYLEERGGSANKEDALKALMAGGCDLGSRPPANLSTTITRNPRLFIPRGERVCLAQAEAA